MVEKIKCKLVVEKKERVNALEELLCCTGNPKQIIITSYSFTDPFDKQDTSHKKFIIKIRRLSSAGVNISLFIPKANISKQNRGLLSLLLKENLQIFLSLYSNPERWHSKLVLRRSRCKGVNECKSYIGSANFTYSGVNNNFETGVILENETIFNTILAKVDIERNNALKTKLCDEDDLND